MARRMTVLALLLALLAMGASSAAEGEYYGSHPAEDIFMTQTHRHTCTLIATTMMLRSYSSRLGSPYGHVTESGVGNFAWIKGRGLRQTFSIGQVTVNSSADIRSCGDRKAYLIEALQAHPEGVVIYDTGAPHAIWLFGYDVDSDTFYCADTIASRGGRAIPLEDSIIRGATQADKVNTIDKIWYIE